MRKQQILDHDSLVSLEQRIQRQLGRIDLRHLFSVDGNTTITRSSDQGFPYWTAWGTILRGWAWSNMG